MIHSIRSIPIVLAIATLMTCAGCPDSGPKRPPTVPAEGVLYLDGNPFEGAIIVFIANQGEYNATASSDSNGKFSLKAFDEKKGAVPGEYKVQVSKTLVEKLEKGGEAGVNLKQALPVKYSNIGTSGLAFKIPEAGDKNMKIELKSK